MALGTLHVTISASAKQRLDDLRIDPERLRSIAVERLHDVYKGFERNMRAVAAVGDADYLWGDGESIRSIGRTHGDDEEINRWEEEGGSTSQVIPEAEAEQHAVEVGEADRQQTGKEDRQEVTRRAGRINIQGINVVESNAVPPGMFIAPYTATCLACGAYNVSIDRRESCRNCGYPLGYR